MFTTQSKGAHFHIFQHSRIISETTQVGIHFFKVVQLESLNTVYWLLIGLIGSQNAIFLADFDTFMHGHWSLHDKGNKSISPIPLYTLRISTYIQLKADQLHPQNYLHRPAEYRHSDKECKQFAGAKFECPDFEGGASFRCATSRGWGKFQCTGI